MATALAKLGDKPNVPRNGRQRLLPLAPDDYLTLYNIACYYSVSGLR